MTPIELFEANSHFHETLARWSNNRFLLYAVRYTNQLRRLVEYRQAQLDRPQRRRQTQEHLAILEAIAGRRREEAATLLRRHLAGARQEKVWA